MLRERLGEMGTEDILRRSDLGRWAWGGLRMSKWSSSRKCMSSHSDISAKRPAERGRQEGRSRHHVPDLPPSTAID